MKIGTMLKKIFNDHQFQIDYQKEAKRQVKEYYLDEQINKGK